MPEGGEHGLGAHMGALAQSGDVAFAWQSLPAARLPPPVGGLFGDGDAVGQLAYGQARRVPEGMEVGCLLPDDERVTALNP